MDARDWGRVRGRMEEVICNSSRLEQPGSGVNDMHTGFEARWPAEMDTVRAAVSQWKGTCKSGHTTAARSPPS